MGLTKQYLRYVPAGNFNIIASSNCNIVFVALEGQVGRYVAVGACEHIIIWDLRLGEKAQVLPGEKEVVSVLSAHPNRRHLAAGYSDGNVQVYDLKTSEIVSIFSGHRSEVTALAYDELGHKLASGSKDTDIIVWDTVAEVGICRLVGHRGPITNLVFMAQHPILISGSKDTFVKFWDLDTEHCFKTLVGHHTEVWALTLMKNDQFLITGCGDGELRVWKIIPKDGSQENDVTVHLQLIAINDTDDFNSPVQCTKVGSLLRSGRGRVVSMFSDENNRVVGVHGTDNQVELFYFCTEEEAKNRLKKRLKKDRKKEMQKESMETEEEKPNDVDKNLELTLSDEVKRLTSIKLQSKPKSLHLVLGNGGELRVSVVLANNTVELYATQTGVKNAEAKCLRSIVNQGHHSEVRSVCFSSDSLAIVSGSAEAVKIWNRTSQICLRTIKTEYVLSVVFVPGDRHVLAGMKSGQLLILDIVSGDVLEEIPAHSSELWSICLQPDLRGCVSGGGDHTVKFWNFELVVDDKSESKAKVLSLLHTRTLKLEDGVLCVKISPNGKFIAVALLDSTVKIFFVDTFKFYLSLYGHKLPVLCMDISSDSTLIVTGSADRNVKIWGMDFGDCHKNLFAHNDSVTGVQFVPKTHYFFSCGKDGNVKEWDADSFQKIITLQGHVGECWALAVSPNGQHVVSCGADRVLRLYEKTDQVLVLQDEEEEEREKQEALATGEKTNVSGHAGLNLPSKKTIGSEKAAESILECLEICQSYQEQLAEHEAIKASTGKSMPNPPVHPLMLAFDVSTTDDFFLETIRRIRASDLEEALLLLPFTTVSEVLKLLPRLVKRGDSTELVCKLVIFLVKIHHAPLVANHMLLPVMKQLQQLTMSKVNELRDLVGYNLYSMKFMQREMEIAEGVQLFRDATKERKRGEKKRRQREKIKRSILTLSS